MSTSSRNDIRIQCLTDSRTVAVIAKYFEENNVGVSSVSDLLRKALQTFASNILHQIDHIPSKQEAQQIIQNIAQQGSGFTTNTPYIPIKPKNNESSETIIETLMKKHQCTREKAEYMAAQYQRAKL